MSERKIRLALGDLLIMLDSVREGLRIESFSGNYSRETRQGVFETVHNQIAYVPITVTVETDEDEQEKQQSDQEGQPPPPKGEGLTA